MLNFATNTTQWTPQKMMSDVSSGIVAGTRVATQIGWRVIEAVSVVDKVLTFDAGLQPVIGVTRHLVWTADIAEHTARWPLQVPG